MNKVIVVYVPQYVSSLLMYVLAQTEINMSESNSVYINFLFCSITLNRASSVTYGCIIIFVSDLWLLCRTPYRKVQYIHFPFQLLSKTQQGNEN